MASGLASAIVNTFSDHGNLVVDPMCGSGSTVIAASNLGRTAVGVDADPLSVLISRCSVASYDRKKLDDFGYEIEKLAWEIYRSRNDTSAHSSGMDDETLDFVDFWFPPRSIRELSALSSAISRYPDNEYQDFAKLVFSSLIIAKHATSSYAMDLPRSRPHKVLSRAPISPLNEWEKKYQALVHRLQLVQTGNKGTARVDLGDARNLDIPSGSVDLVATSPPYASAIDYIRTSKFSLVWFGYSISDLRTCRSGLIGTEQGLWSRDGIPDELEDYLYTAANSQRHVARGRRYLSDIRHVLAECYRVLRPNRLCVFVVADWLVDRERRDSIKVLGTLAENVGFEMAAVQDRKIVSRLRSLPTPDNSSNVPLSKRIRSEQVIVMQRK